MANGIYASWVGGELGNKRYGGKIWKATAYVCIRREERPENGNRIEQGISNNGGLLYFGKSRCSFSVRYDERSWSALSLEMLYLEVNGILGSHDCISPFDMYVALMGGGPRHSRSKR